MRQEEENYEEDERCDYERRWLNSAYYEARGM